MIKHFVIIWLMYWLFFLIMPITSVYDNVLSAFFLQFSFTALVIVGFLLTSKYWRIPHHEFYFVPKQIYKSTFAIKLSIILSLIGIICLGYDRIFIQHVSYINGLAEARNQWRISGIERSGQISSIFSMIGNMLSSSYFVASYYIIVSGRCLPSKLSIFAIFFVFVCVMLNSILSGGRSSILLLAFALLAGVCVARQWSLKYIIRSKALRYFIMFLMLIAFFYTIFVFYSRSEATGISPVAYTQKALAHLKLQSDFVASLSPGLFADIAALIVLAGGYLLHSFSIAAAILLHGPGDSYFLLTYPVTILYKLGIVDFSGPEWFLSGRFPSLPASLYYTFGAFGFIVASLFVGIIAGASCTLLTWKQGSFVITSLFMAVYLILAMSPFLFAVNVMAYPFAIASFIIVGVVYRVTEAIFSPTSRRYIVLG